MTVVSIELFAFILCPFPTMEYNSDQVKKFPFPLPSNSPISRNQTIILYALTLKKVKHYVLPNGTWKMREKNSNLNYYYY